VKEKKVIAVEEGITRVVNNVKLYHRLLTKFSGRQMVEDLVRAAGNGNFEEAANACHALKGMAANLAMHLLADITARVEKQLLAGVFPEDLMAELYENLEAVEKAIEEIVSE
jgi:HPt (histidine-containing phosphotransfer) domain-containing protein